MLMMSGFESDIFGVDSLQVGSLAEALLGGSSVDATTSVASSAVPLWNTDPVNAWLVVAFTITGMITLPRLVHIAPMVWNCIWRTKGSYNIYVSVPLWRERNMVSLLCIVPFCLMVSRSRIFRLEAMEGMTEGQSTLLILGIFIGWLIVRAAVEKLLAPRNSSEDWKIAVSNPRNFFIAATMAMVAITALELITDWSLNVTGRLSLLIIGLLYSLLLLRNLEILSRKYHHFKAFLYLCALEGFTSALLITCTLIF